MKRNFEIKSELLYLLLITIVTVYFSYITHTSGFAYLFTGALGLTLLLTWFVRAFALYSGRRISQYSEVIQRISVKDRFFSYFILPAIFYISLLLYIYYNTSFQMDLVLVFVASIQILVLFLNVKSSLSKVYTIASQTRAVFDFVCISTFYLLVSVYIRLGLDILFFLPLIFITSLILFWFDIKIHSRESISGFLLSLFSSLFVAIFACSFFSTNIFVIPAISTLAFYLILSLWNIRFSGKVKLVDYIVPFLYSILALILILKL